MACQVMPVCADRPGGCSRRTMNRRGASFIFKKKIENPRNFIIPRNFRENIFGSKHRVPSCRALAANSSSSQPRPSCKGLAYGTARWSHDTPHKAPRGKRKRSGEEPTLPISRAIIIKRAAAGVREQSRTPLDACVSF